MATPENGTNLSEDLDIEGPQTSLLTADEQSAIYKQASLLAIYAMSNKNGATKAKEMLAVVTKVKNFLTNLVQLAGNSGPQVKTAVHSLVQKLVAGSITEEEFAKKIELDLKSKHQPDLLPFLQASVPDLRTHLQIQKEYMKQLIDKKVQEKNASSSTTTSSGGGTVSLTDSSAPPQDTLTSSSQAQTSSSASTSQVTTPTTTDSPKPPTVGQTPSPSPGAVNLASIGVTPAQQQALRVQLAKLPEDQRKPALEKFIQNRQLQIMLQKQKNTLLKNASSGSGVSPSLVTAITSVAGTAVSGGVTEASKLTQQQQINVILRQQQLIKEQQQQATLVLGGGGASGSSPQRSASPRKGGLTGLMGKLKMGGKDDSPGSPSSKSKVQEEEEEEESIDNIAGVNLKEETAHFLPATSDTPTQSITDETFLSTSLLKSKVKLIGSCYGITDASEEYLTFLSHATEERLRNLVEQVTVISQHRTEVLKGNSHYEPATDVRGQLKVLERIDEVSATRKQEREKEKIIRAAKSRSKQDDPELAKMKEQAKQIQIAEEREIHQKAANVLALAAIGRRKRTATTAFGDNSSGNAGSSNSASNVFNTPSSSRTNRPKQRRILSKDVMMVMEQSRETRHSQILYKSYFN